MSQFSIPWRVRTERTDYGFKGKTFAFMAFMLVAAVVGFFLNGPLFGGHPVANLLFVVFPLLGFAAGATVFVVVTNYRLFGAILFKVAGLVLLGAVFSTCVAVWAINVLFAWVTTDLASRVSEPVGTTWFGGALTMSEITAAVTEVPAWLSCTLWPLQFPYARDLLLVGALFGFFNLVPVYLIWWERKVAGRIQSRPGLMRVGGWHGWAQSFADGIKLVLKEDLVPSAADGILYRAAPYFAVIPALTVFLAIPFGLGYVFRDLDVGLVFILGVLGIEVVAVILGGWASNNKWSLYGGMREACQMISYEIPMGMAVMIPVICVGSLSLAEIGDFQRGGWFDWLVFANPFTFLAFGVYFIASLASCKRTPFDLAEAESELVGGFHTEYSGFRWALFFFAEYASMFVVSAIATIIFLGGWNSILPVAWGEGWGDGLLVRGIRGVIFSGPLWFVAKTIFLTFVQIWLRWTLPRVRIDQLLYACVQVLLPLAMVLLMGNAIWVWGLNSEARWFEIVDLIVRIVLGIVGAVVMFGFPVIAAYGFYNRRKLVGSLAVDLLPAS